MDIRWSLSQFPTNARAFIIITLVAWLAVFAGVSYLFSTAISLWWGAEAGAVTGIMTWILLGLVPFVGSWTFLATLPPSPEMALLEFIGSPEN